jgi:hypothetical protein
MVITLDSLFFRFELISIGPWVGNWGMFWLVPEATGQKKWESNSTVKGKKKRLREKKEEKNGRRGSGIPDRVTERRRSEALAPSRIALPGQNSITE